MSFFQFWWRTLVLSTQHNPPEFVEHLMMLLAMALGVAWSLTDEWPYLVLSSSYAIGAAISMWVRQLSLPLPYSRMVPIPAALLLICGLSAFVYPLYEQLAPAVILPPNFP